MLRLPLLVHLPHSHNTRMTQKIVFYIKKHSYFFLCNLLSAVKCAAMCRIELKSYVNRPCAGCRGTHGIQKTKVISLIINI